MPVPAVVVHAVSARPTRRAADPSRAPQPDTHATPSTGRKPVSLRRRAGPRRGQPPGRTGPRPNHGTPPAHTTAELKRCCGQSLLCVCAVACGCAQPLPFSAFLGLVASLASSGSFPVAGPVEPLLFGSLTCWAALIFPCPLAARLFHVGQPPIARVRTDSGVDASMRDIHSAHFTQSLRERLPTRLARVGRSCVLHRRRGVTSVVFGLDRNGAVVVARCCRPHPSPTLRLRCPPTRQLVIATVGAHLSPTVAVSDIHSAHRTEPLRERLPTRPAQTRLGGCSRCCVRTHPISPSEAPFAHVVPRHPEAFGAGA